MAKTQRYTGDAEGVVNVDRGLATDPSSAPGQIISTGIGKHITAIKVLGGATFDTQMGVGGAVETVLRVLQQKATSVAYQVDGTQISVIVEATGWGVTDTTGNLIVSADADLTSALVAVGNRALDANVPQTAYNFTTITATSTGGIKFA